MSFVNKTALITGSGRGIGKAIAIEFAKQGANVVISDINAEMCASTAEELNNGVLQSTENSALGIAADVTESAAVEKLVNETVGKFGSLDVVVNNAGITRDTLLVRMSEEDWDSVIRINLRGAFIVTRATAKIMMKQRSGRIVNIASVVGMLGNAGQANYAASKAGLIGLTKSSARELAPRGITVNAVAPGYINTEMTQAMTEQATEAFLKTVPLRRKGESDDVAAAVLFLASESAGYITGQTISVCGGINI
jgi:3-oxoacyl-[acyl-carrier protein] reductase